MGVGVLTYHSSTSGMEIVLGQTLIHEELSVYLKIVLGLTDLSVVYLASPLEYLVLSQSSQVIHIHVIYLCLKYLQVHYKW